MLRGTDGSRDVIVNSHGKEVGMMGQELATPGQDLRLTIDLDIQMAAEQALEGKIGAIVAMDPHTGEILAMVSRPTFDPNQFLHLTQAYWQSILDDPDHPLMNKAIQAQLAPGSTFKVIMTYAGLQETSRRTCTSAATAAQPSTATSSPATGTTARSTSTTRCRTPATPSTTRSPTGSASTPSRATPTRVGIGVKTGIDLPDEAAGIMPSEAWKLKTQHDKWYAGETISVGIGQGAIEATPLQLARALSGIASGGVLRRPHVVFPDELSRNSSRPFTNTYPGSGEKTVPTHHRQLADHHRRHGQRHPGPIGTAAEAHLEGIDFAGKTGTAAGHEPDALQRPARPQAPCRTPGSSAWPRAATRTSSSPCCGSTATGATTPPSSPRRSSTPSSPSSAPTPAT